MLVESSAPVSAVGPCPSCTHHLVRIAINPLFLKQIRSSPMQAIQRMRKIQDKYKGRRTRSSEDDGRDPSPPAAKILAMRLLPAPMLVQMPRSGCDHRRLLHLRWHLHGAGGRSRPPRPARTESVSTEIVKTRPSSGAPLSRTLRESTGSAHRRRLRHRDCPHGGPAVLLDAPVLPAQHARPGQQPTNDRGAP